MISFVRIEPCSCRICLD